MGFSYSSILHELLHYWLSCLRCPLNICGNNSQLPLSFNLTLQPRHIVKAGVQDFYNTDECLLDPSHCRMSSHTEDSAEIVQHTRVFKWRHLSISCSNSCRHLAHCRETQLPQGETKVPYSSFNVTTNIYALTGKWEKQVLGVHFLCLMLTFIFMNWEQVIKRQFERWSTNKVWSIHWYSYRKMVLKRKNSKSKTVFTYFTDVFFFFF